MGDNKDPLDENGLIEEVKGPVCIFISDMSGFTSLVKKLGVIHFTSLLLKMRKVGVPILESYDVYHIFFEADNIWALFRDPINAVLAACDFLHCLKIYNESVSNFDFKVRLSGIGLHYGEGVFKDKEGKFYGKDVNIGFKVGEDLCEGGEVLVTQRLYDIIISHEAFKDVEFIKDHSDDFGGFDYYHLRGDTVYKFQPSDIGPYYEEPNQKNEFLSRLETNALIGDIDQSIREKYEKLDVASVMFGVDWDDIIDKHGVLHMLQVQSQFLSMLDRVFGNRGGKQMSPLIFFFDDPVKAVEGCIEARNIIVNEMNKDDKTSVPLKGFGVHIGLALHVPGTDILFGDPINVSSKLAEDIAEDMEINITGLVISRIKDIDLGVEFTPKTKETSGVTFNYFSC